VRRRSKGQTTALALRAPSKSPVCLARFAVRKVRAPSSAPLRAHAHASSATPSVSRRNAPDSVAASTQLDKPHVSVRPLRNPERFRHGRKREFREHARRSGSNCCGKIANTQAQLTPIVKLLLSSRLNINPAEWDALDRDGQCSVMLHELMHWAGDTAGPAHDTLGTDVVYSCGRYCGRCSHAGKGAPATSAVDCARCAADDALRRHECGYQYELVDASCGSMYCEDMGGISVPATSCATPIPFDCNGEIFPGGSDDGGTGWCATACPIGAVAQDPCSNYDSQLVDACQNPPPWCK
jgi:hypothetical protein